MTATNAVDLSSVRQMRNNRKAKSDKEVAFQKTMGKALLALRKSAGLEREQLAQMLKERYNDVTGFNTTSLCKAEDGERALTPFRIACIADFFEVPISSLFGADYPLKEVTRLAHYKDAEKVSADFRKLSRGDTVFITPVKLTAITSGDHPLHGTYRLLLPDGSQWVHVRKKLTGVDGAQYAIETELDTDTMTFDGVVELFSAATAIHHLNSAIKLAP